MRLFVALALPENLAEQLERMCSGLPGANWVPPENFHLTLRFIGACDGHEAGDLDAALSTVKAAPFDLSLTGLGQFGEGRRTRSVWAGTQPSDELSALQSRVERVVQTAGFEPESRKFHPHVTLARFGSSPGGKLRTYFAQHALFRTLPFRVTEFHLYSSELGKGPPMYRREATYPLESLEA
ncbi:RNA 2',3'-cyclic phosphodiesterase [Denitrobaculum tricleocarpae]|uniref:RNA 2',3'-cyclic phosphodiesterase n=1 Tax=Denitrobaculum tricleocarpae TaxID=2591009 RepID=A0A545TR67_9PROT|nr:RNA 2',3'-cyclic phosphodiesterase [Denitrobaculum tricleocarpae]TQV79706.1 RNA 2',3'-cyclic phosphodiesterase [Denitrobaculum tricleocarpae]